MFSPILSPLKCHNIRNHIYRAEGVSFLDPYLQPFWKWVAAKIPIWMAPNVITIFGLVVNILSTCAVLYYCPTATEEPARWTLFLCAACLFAYQTADALDGIQGRRVNQSGSLEEIFDHGCDGISCLFVSLSTANALQLGRYPIHFFLFNFNNIFVFYLAQWQTYATGILKYGKFDCVEIHVLGVLQFLLLGTTGSPILSLQLFNLPYFGPVVFWQAAVYSVYISSCLYAISQFSTLWYGAPEKEGSSVAGTSIWLPGIPFGLVMLSAFYVIKCSTCEVFHRELNLVMIVFGVCLTKLTWKLLIEIMAKHPLEMVESSMLGPFALALVSYFNIPVDQYQFLVFVVVYECANFSWYAAKVCREVGQCLNLDLFTLKPKSGS